MPSLGARTVARNRDNFKATNRVALPHRGRSRMPLFNGLVAALKNLRFFQNLVRFNDRLQLLFGAAVTLI